MPRVLVRRVLHSTFREPPVGNAPTRVILVVSCLLAACSSRQLYDSAQGWQRNECNRLLDLQDRRRCMESTATSYDDYKRQTDPARSTR